MHWAGTTLNAESQSQSDVHISKVAHTTSLAQVHNTGDGTQQALLKVHLVLCESPSISVPYARSLTQILEGQNHRKLTWFPNCWQKSDVSTLHISANNCLSAGSYRKRDDKVRFASVESVRRFLLNHTPPHIADSTTKYVTIGVQVWPGLRMHVHHGGFNEYNENQAWDTLAGAMHRTQRMSYLDAPNHTLLDYSNQCTVQRTAVYIRKGVTCGAIVLKLTFFSLSCSSTGTLITITPLSGTCDALSVA